VVELLMRSEARLRELAKSFRGVELLLVPVDITARFPTATTVTTPTTVDISDLIPADATSVLIVSKLRYNGNTTTLQARSPNSVATALAVTGKAEFSIGTPGAQVNIDWWEIPVVNGQFEAWWNTNIGTNWTGLFFTLMGYSKEG
jgi:hypothetical protein